jgi:hypothetical protein
MLGVYLFTVKTMECKVKGAGASMEGCWWLGITYRQAGRALPASDFVVYALIFRNIVDVFWTSSRESI